MFCPIKVRTNWFQTPPIPAESLRLEHNWLICRQMIVFSGNIMTLVYSFMIVFVLNWMALESKSLPKHLAKYPVDSDYRIVYFCGVFSFIGCLSTIFKSNFNVYLEMFTDVNDTGRRVTIKKPKVKRDIECEKLCPLIAEPVIDFSKQKLKLLKNSFTYNPIYTINVVLLLALMPFEIWVAKSAVVYCLDNYTNYWVVEEKRKNYVLLMALCLMVLIVSAVIIQTCIVVYYCDLIDTSIDKKTQTFAPRRRTSSAVDRRTGSPERYQHIKRQRMVDIQRQKNIRFHNFLTQYQSSLQTSPKLAADQRLKRLSVVGAHCSTSFSSTCDNSIGVDL
ncbi:unnamed protein product [Medioppia subpectinata]|uniref:Uncharacterized protein n=1 Tax=Medioppia subpectinata TaxID=1979941 RepID=A0A7R9KWV6_9ACAR|nr:unnamed protein product [Medioppia subpectinata]CAG2111334.1 unnamed protein product [Medioppia subpectinata]